MGMYRKKPVVIEAELWLTFDDSNSILKEVKQVRDRAAHEGRCNQCGKRHSEHGWLDMTGERSKIAGYIICPGDWIVRGEKGNLYPVKATVFDVLYEEVGYE